MFLIIGMDSCELPVVPWKKATGTYWIMSTPKVVGHLSRSPLTLETSLSTMTLPTNKNSLIAWTPPNRRKLLAFILTLWVTWGLKNDTSDKKPRLGLLLSPPHIYGHKMCGTVSSLQLWKQLNTPWSLPHSPKKIVLILWRQFYDLVSDLSASSTGSHGLLFMLPWNTKALVFWIRGSILHLHVFLCCSFSSFIPGTFKLTSKT